MNLSSRLFILVVAGIRFEDRAPQNAPGVYGEQVETVFAADAAEARRIAAGRFNWVGSHCVRVLDGADKDALRVEYRAQAERLVSAGYAADLKGVAAKLHAGYAAERRALKLPVREVYPSEWTERALRASIPLAGPLAVRA